MQCLAQFRNDASVFPPRQQQDEGREGETCLDFLERLSGSDETPADGSWAGLDSALVEHPDWFLPGFADKVADASVTFKDIMEQLNSMKCDGTDPACAAGTKDRNACPKDWAIKCGAGRRPIARSGSSTPPAHVTAVIV